MAATGLLADGGTILVCISPLKTENGLSNNNVKAILKDREGFLWIGTENGLNRYDGYSFKVYHAENRNNHSLSSSDIWTLQEDRLGNLWIWNGTTYNVYNRNKDNFITDIPKFMKRMDIRIKDSYKIHIDKKQNLWVIEGTDILYYNFSDQTLTKINWKDFTDATSELSVSDDGENLYILQNSKHLWKIESKNKECKKLNTPRLPEEVDGRGQVYVYIDRHGGIWLYSYIDEWISYKKKTEAECMGHRTKRILRIERKEYQTY